MPIVPLVIAKAIHINNKDKVVNICGHLRGAHFVNKVAEVAFKLVLGDIFEDEVTSKDIDDGATQFIMMPNVEEAIKIYHFFMLLFRHLITIITKS